MQARTVNAKRNIFSGIIKQVISTILPFVLRTIIIYVLGIEYQGISGLFSSILQVLNLADLGFSNAVIYVLYKPIVENDEQKICSIMKYLRTAYFAIGLIILIGGFIVLPFLDKLIAGSVPSGINIYIVFVIYLLNTSVSYLFFSYKSALLNAYQRDDVVSNIYIIVNCLIKLIQIVLLLLFKNFYVYLVIIIAGTVLNNIMLQIASKKLFPEIKPTGKIDSETKNTLDKQVKAVFACKLGDTARNSFDNIVISILLGLTAVAIYDNYYYIHTAICGVFTTIIHAVQASVGNSIAECDKEKNRNDLGKFTFLFMWLIGWCTICLLCLYQPFMMIWMNNDKGLLLSFFDMLLFCVYFYAINMNNTRNLYISGAGLYPNCKLWFIVEAIGNLLLNLLLGYFFGITGILIATIVTVFVFNFITRTNVLFKNYFKSTSKKFYLEHLIYFVVTAFASFLTYMLCSIIPTEGVLDLVIRIIICCIIPNVIFFLCYFKTSQFKGSIVFVKKLLRNRK